MINLKTIPTNVSVWLADLNAQPPDDGWRSFESVGSTVADGVQCRTIAGNDDTCAWVFGNVVSMYRGRVEVRWSVYCGNDQTPIEAGFEGPAEAMKRAERLWPRLFSQTGKERKIQC